MESSMTYEEQIEARQENTALRARHTALVEAVAWERECNALKHAVWRDDSPFELHEVWKTQQAASAEVDRLIANESASDCEGEG